MLQKATFLFLWLRLIFPNLYTENKSINQSWWSCRTDVTFVWHNNNNNGWEAHYLCLSAPSAVGQTRHNLNCTNCPTDILKCVQNQLWCCFNSLMRRINSTSLSLGGCSQNLLFFFMEDMMMTKSSSMEDDSIFLPFCSVLVQNFFVNVSFVNFCFYHKFEFFASEHFEFLCCLFVMDLVCKDLTSCAYVTILCQKVL